MENYLNDKKIQKGEYIEVTYPDGRKFKGIVTKTAREDEGIKGFHISTDDNTDLNIEVGYQVQIKRIKAPRK